MSHQGLGIGMGQMDVERSDRAQRRRRRTLLVAAAALALAIAAGWAYRSLGLGVTHIAADQLWVDTVKFGDFERSVRGTGRLTPKIQRWLAAQSVGTVEHVSAPPGTQVRADDVVLELSNPDLLDQLIDAKTALVAAQSDETSKRLTLEGQVMDVESSLATMRAEHRLAQLQNEREAKLLEDRLVSQIEFMQTRGKLEALGEQLNIGERRLAGLRRNVVEQVEAGKARTDQLRQAVIQKERQIDSLSVRAGIDGVVQSIEATEGKQVAAGGALALVVKPSPLQVELDVPEAQAKDLSLGMVVKVDLRSAVFSGHIARIAPSVKNAAVAILVEPDGDLPPGARPDLGVSGVVQIDRIPNALTIARPPDVKPDSTISVYRLGTSGHAQRISVRVGRVSSDRVEILGGLAKGDRVVLSNMADWNNPSSFIIQ